MFSKFPSIDQFRGAITKARFHYGADADITLNFKGTVKLHGTNAAVAWDGQSESELVMQSRNRLITLEDDNAGFAKFVSSRVESIKNIFHKMFQQVPLDDGETAYLYGEWCGKGIQKGVAVATLDPMFVMFNVAYVSKEQDGEAKRRWLPASIFDVLGKLSEARAVWASDKIYSIYQFSNWSKDIHFTQPDLGVVQNQIVALTLQVEAECPVGKYFGVSGIGEGIVWTSSFVSPRDGNQHQLRFKVKGAEHSVSKVKTLAGVDTEKLKNIEEFLSYSVTENRMEQGYDELYTKRGISASINDLGKFISWVRDDILKEESDTLAASGIDKKDLGKPMSSRVRRWFTDTLDREASGDVVVSQFILQGSGSG